MALDDDEFVMNLAGACCGKYFLITCAFAVFSAARAAGWVVMACCSHKQATMCMAGCGEFDGMRLMGQTRGSRRTSEHGVKHIIAFREV